MNNQVLLPAASQTQVALSIGRISSDTIGINKPEYILIINHNYFSENNHFQFMSNSLQTGKAAFVDLDAIQQICDNIFHILKLRKRYLKLQEENSDIGVSSEGFHILGHTFQTLDELEHALKNKAFL